MAKISHSNPFLDDVLLPPGEQVKQDCEQLDAALRSTLDTFFAKHVNKIDGWADRNSAHEKLDDLMGDLRGSLVKDAEINRRSYA